MIVPSRARRGFTLIEVLSVMGVTLLLFGLVIRIFMQSQDAVGHTVDKVEAVQNARHLVDKLVPIVSVAGDPSQLGARPVRLHLPADGLDEENFAQPTWLDIITPHDFLGPAPARPDEFLPMRQLFAFRYRIDYVPEEGVLYLRRMSGDGTTFDAETKPRVIGARLAGLQFRPVIHDESLIEVRVRVEQDTTLRQDVGTNRVVETAATLHIPAESLR